jgi:hypothetical protein
MVFTQYRDTSSSNAPESSERHSCVPLILRYCVSRLHRTTHHLQLTISQYISDTRRPRRPMSQNTSASACHALLANTSANKASDISSTCAKSTLPNSVDYIQIHTDDMSCPPHPMSLRLFSNSNTTPTFPSTSTACVSVSACKLSLSAKRLACSLVTGDLAIAPPYCAVHFQE